MAGKRRVLVLSSVALAFAAGFLLAFFLGRSRPMPDVRGMLRVPPENSLILIGRFPPGWPPEFPLPKRSRPKWAAATVTAINGRATPVGARTWTCFTYERVGDGPLGSRLVRWFQRELKSIGYVFGPARELKIDEGSFLFRFPFYYDFKKVPPDHEGFITVPDDATALEVGGIDCGFSVEVTDYPE